MMRRKDTVTVSVWRANPNHHLWNNNGTWFVHYTVHGTDFTKQRLRRSLQTKCLEEARRRRDELFAQGCDGLDAFPSGTRLMLAI